MGLIDGTKFLKQVPTSQQVANKIVAQIPKFSGTNPQYTWEQFMARMHIAASSQVYSDTELKLILFQSLDAEAFAYLTANIHLTNFPYQEVVSHLAQVYSKKKLQNVSDMARVVQMPNETVSAYAARLVSAVGQLRPIAPSPMKMVIVDGIRTPRANPNYKEEKAKYDGQLEQLEIFLIAQFLAGLKTELKQAMKPEQHTAFAQCRKSASETESYMLAQGLYSINATMDNLSIDGATGVNAVYGKNPTLNKLEKGQKKKKPIQCYRCHGYDHFARDCTAPAPVSNASGAQRGHPANANRGQPSGRPNRSRFPRTQGYGNQGYRGYTPQYSSAPMRGPPRYPQYQSQQYRPQRRGRGGRGYGRGRGQYRGQGPRTRPRIHKCCRRTGI